MDHVKALVIKFLMTTIVLGIVLTGIFDGEFSDTLLISLVLTVGAYVLGDLLIFRKAGDDHKPNADQPKRNVIATIADAILSFLVIWLMSEALFVNNTQDLVMASLLSAALLGVGEWFFHKYLDNHVFDEKHPHHTTGH